MKHIKTLGLAVVAAMALMAFLGASTALATVFKEETSPGVVHTLADGPIPIKSSLTSETTASLADTAGNPIETCTTSSVEGSITNTGGVGATVSGPVSHLTFGGEGCNVTVLQSKNGSLEIHHIASTDNGTVTGSGFHVEIHVFGTTCTYGLGANTDLGIFTGTRATGSEPTYPTLHLNAIVTRVTGSFLCPSSGRWIATFEMTTDGLFLAP